MSEYIFINLKTKEIIDEQDLSNGDEAIGYAKGLSLSLKIKVVVYTKVISRK